MFLLVPSNYSDFVDADFVDTKVDRRPPKPKRRRIRK